MPLIRTCIQKLARLVMSSPESGELCSSPPDASAKPPLGGIRRDDEVVVSVQEHDDDSDDVSLLFPRYSVGIADVSSQAVASTTDEGASVRSLAGGTTATDYDSSPAQFASPPPPNVARSSAGGGKDGRKSPLDNNDKPVSPLHLSSSNSTVINDSAVDDAKDAPTPPPSPISSAMLTLHPAGPHARAIADCKAILLRGAAAWSADSIKDTTKTIEAALSVLYKALEEARDEAEAHPAEVARRMKTLELVSARLEKLDGDETNVVLVAMVRAGVKGVLVEGRRLLGCVEGEAGMGEVGKKEEGKGKEKGDVETKSLGERNESEEVEMKSLKENDERQERDIDMKSLKEDDEPKKKDVDIESLTKPNDSQEQDVDMKSLKELDESKEQGFDIKSLSRPDEPKEQDADMKSLKESIDPKAQDIDVESLTQPDEPEKQDASTKSLNQPDESKEHEVDMHSLKENEDPKKVESIDERKDSKTMAL
ncbi:hypothetical protein BU26DRAFT_594608 [Trematosphaeria pertusa]|uniref:Uncharacterized protein n=1 Tax=Trematosphaeria pertusa TaxID=390896 RepID=A0A6A6IEP6_9PLEO|nr:uncharacterized protein BU26DRAFT_594608 [Trematosphaeria pertusa]KAF2248876.1 hypothetical protein BU26DRAFT_594608 [Trematosphaeria pertusa]